MHKQNTIGTGFTIVELLIVVVVIAILAAISTVAYTNIQSRAHASAHKHNASQAERSIVVHALQTTGEEITIESGSLVGYREGQGSIDLIEPLVGTPDITMYVVYEVVNASQQYSPIARLTPMTWDSRGFMINTGTAGGSRMVYRIDTSAQANVGGPSPTGVWVPGSTAICWMQFSAAAMASAFNCNQPAANVTVSITPHAGWNFTALTLMDANDRVQLGLVFNAAHDQVTRAQVIDWLANKYGVSP